MLPWKETSVESERLRFIERVTAGEEPVTELCRQSGISRKTGYKLIHRYEAHGEDGLLDRSRAPHYQPNATPRELAERIVEAKCAHPTWGPKKLVAWLRDIDPGVSWPAPSTAGAILDRAGLTLPGAPGSPVLFEITYSGTDEFKFFAMDTNHGASYERRLTPDRLFGPYEGVRAIAHKDGRFEDQQKTADGFNIHVEGTGAWEVKVGLPDFGAPPVTSAKGLGDEVIGPFVLRSGNPFVTDFVFEVTHQGRDFQARLIASDGTARALVPQQIAPFKNKTLRKVPGWGCSAGA